MPALPRLLLLGDSIRMSYQPFVIDLLKDRAHVVGPAENCQTSGNTLARIDGWLKELGAPDVVHWNNGLWDVGHNPERDPVQFPVETYIDNLRAILDKLQATGAKIIWATTTPVHPDRPWKDTGWSWCNQEINRYNTEARDMMRAEGISIDDLHGIVNAQPDKHLDEDKLHLSNAGRRACAEAVVKAVEEYL